MASLVETGSEEVGNLSDIKKSLQEDLSQLVEQNTKKPNEAANAQDKELQSDDEALPIKLRGKSREEIAEMYRNLESSYGRMANDLGQQRTLTDRLLNLKRETDLANNGGKVEPPKIKSSDLLDDPGKAISDVIEARLKAEREAEQAQRATLAQEEAARRFHTTHPDFEQYINSQEFKNWIDASPSRRRTAAMAARGDWDSGTDLLQEFKESRTAKGGRDPNVEAARKAGLESGNSASANANQQQGKIYRRTDLMKLLAEDPETYYSEDFQKVIMKAYAEKRVR